MVYKGYNKANDFKKFKTICVFGNEIRNKIIQQSILKILKVRQDHKFLLKKSLKKLC